MRNTPLTRAICKVGVAILARSGVPLPGHAGAPPDKITYILDWFPPGEATFPSAAPHEGLFAKEGPDVTGRGSTDSITKAAAGSMRSGRGALMAAAEMVGWDLTVVDGVPGRLASISIRPRPPS